jgi:hypothetical protein
MQNSCKEIELVNIAQLFGFRNILAGDVMARGARA